MGDFRVNIGLTVKRVMHTCLYVIAISVLLCEISIYYVFFLAGDKLLPLYIVEKAETCLMISMNNVSIGCSSASNNRFLPPLDSFREVAWFDRNAMRGIGYDVRAKSADALKFYGVIWAFRALFVNLWGANHRQDDRSLKLEGRTVADILPGHLHFKFLAWNKASIGTHFRDHSPWPTRDQHRYHQ